MGMLADIVTATAGPLAPRPPDHEVLAVRLREAQDAIPALVRRHELANFDYETLGTPESSAALATAQAALNDGRDRVDRLTMALKTAQQRAVERAAADAARQHAKQLRDLEAFATTYRRKVKTLAIEIARCEKAWAEALEAARPVMEAIPRGAFPQSECAVDGTPMGHLLGAGSLHAALELEVARCVAQRDPTGWATLGRRHFLGSHANLKNSPPAGSGALMSLEDKATQAMGNILARAKAAPVPTTPPPVPVPVTEPAVPTSATVADLGPGFSVETRPPTADTPPARPIKQVTADQIENLEQLKAAWLELNPAADPLEGEELAATLADWEQLNPGVSTGLADLADTAANEGTDQ